MISDSRGVSYKRGVIASNPVAPTSTNVLASSRPEACRWRHLGSPLKSCIPAPSVSPEQISMACQRFKQLVSDLSHGCGNRATGKGLRPGGGLRCPAQAVRSHEAFVGGV
jgi:hypothetical protein